jgi:hypothetical protein
MFAVDDITGPQLGERLSFVGTSLADVLVEHVDDRLVAAVTGVRAPSGGGHRGHAMSTVIQV